MTSASCVGRPLQLLGRFQVRRDGEEVPPAAFGGRKVRTLLRVLAVRRPDLVPHDASPRRCGRTACPPTRRPTSTCSSPAPAGPWAARGRGRHRARRVRAGTAAPSTSTEFLALAQRRGTRWREDRPADAGGCAAALALWGEPLRGGHVRRVGPRAPGASARAPASTCWSTAARAALALGDPRDRGRRTRPTRSPADPLRESWPWSRCAGAGGGG